MSVTSLMGLGVNRKSRDLHRHKAGTNDEQWHIPYNGPYEQRPGAQKPRNRDSWGDPVDGYSEEEMQGPQSMVVKHQLEPIDTKPSTLRPRRTRSGYTPASGINHSAGDTERPPVPSYININPVDGGVGQSPMPPPTLSPRDSAGASSRRKSFINLFSRVGSSPARNRKSALVQEDYYNSYYSTLEPNPVEPDQYSSAESPSALSSSHPYANPYVSSPATPKSAPLLSSKSPRSPRHPHFTLLSPVASTSRNIRNTSSSPDLRNASRSQALHTLNSASARPNIPKKRSFPTRAREKWLSAETWCDAIFFPRPRFKVQRDTTPPPRIVSPPGTPLARDFVSQPHQQDLSVQSRVLAHSRSLVDLNASNKARKEDPFARQQPLSQIASNASSTSVHLSRPKSWALDDLALPSPVPSLAHVLEEGQILEHQRKKWQRQATSSFQNKRSRSASRARAKSAAQNPYSEKEKPSPIAFLAARSFVGNQDTPKINVTPSPTKSQRARSASHTTSSAHSRKSHAATSSMSRSGHAPSNSMSTSKSHAKHDSFGRKVVMAVCGTDENMVITPMEEKAPSPVWTNAVGGDHVRMISASPIYMHDSEQRTSQPYLSVNGDRTGVSPIPSESIGIALSTPPPGQHYDDVEELRMPSHPYAQGGTYTLSSPAQPPPSEYAGPHLIVHPNYPTIGDETGADTAKRYLQPPIHPYAQAQSPQRDSIPPEATMWAQFSTDGLHEIRPNDIQYSPFTSSPTEQRNSEVILDTFGVRDNAKDNDTFRDSGLGSSEAAESHGAGAAMPHGGGREPILQDSVYSRPPWEKPLSPPRPILTNTSSSGNTPSSSSTGLTPPINSDDMDAFQDLFYRPQATSPPRPSLARSNSGLTALARKLSREMEELNMEKQTLASSTLTGPGSTISSPRRRDKGLQFVITADDRMEVLDRNEGTSVMGLERPSIGGFPEDVNSRASTPELVEPRLRKVSELSTPPVTASESRRSFAGLLSYIATPEMDDEDKLSVAERDVQRLTASSLAPPENLNSRSSSDSQLHPGDHARRSYMSGMSLSEFPDPPSSSKMTPAHMSVLNSYFDSVSTPPTEDLPSTVSRPKYGSRRTTLGGGDSAVEAILADLREEDETRTTSENAH